MSVARIEAVRASTDLVSVIAASLPLKRQGSVWTGLCPFHGEKTPSFTVFRKPDHYYCFGCGVRGDVVDWVQLTRRLTIQEALAFLSGNQAGPAPLVRPVPVASIAKDDRAAAWKAEMARRLWNEATEAMGSPVEAYLASRGLKPPARRVLRFHPACPCGTGDDRHLLPAMIALTECPMAGEPTGIHRTFLAADGSGKSPLLEKGRQKLMLGQNGRPSVIRLVEPTGEALGIAEGIEDALSAVQAFWTGPVWSAITAGGIERFPVIPGISLTIFADGDPAGTRAARVCASAWAEAGADVVIKYPPHGDWNAVLLQETA